MNTQFKFLLFLFSCSALSQSSHADDCTYDQENQKLQLKELAEKHAGAQLDLENFSVDFHKLDGTQVKIVRGGCDHLGFSITKKFETDVPISEQRQFELAVELATEFWEASDVKAMHGAISTGDLRKTEVGEFTYYHMQHKWYDEFFIRYVYQSGNNELEIYSMRTF